jgi:anti-anti-sigma regulatory factor
VEPPTADLTIPSRLVLGSLRQQPARDTPRAIAEGPAGRALDRDAICVALAELRVHGLARESRGGRWYLTPDGQRTRSTAAQAEPWCEVAVEERGAATWVTVVGELVREAGERLGAELARVGGREPTVILLDLTGVQAIDGGAIAAIVAGDARGRTSGVRLVVRGAQGLRAAFADHGPLERITFAEASGARAHRFLAAPRRW